MPQAQYLVIGSLWLESQLRAELKQAIKELKDKHKVRAEFKWNKVSRSREEFYKALIRTFFGYGDRVRFRCICVTADQVNLVRYHNGDQELGFYKFYYQLLHHWILDFNQYQVFCDRKKNRDPTRLPILRRCLQASNLSSEVLAIEPVESDESLLIQLADVLTGAASARLNDKLQEGSSKQNVVEEIERLRGCPLAPSRLAERKFNIFRIKLEGGW